MTYSEVAMNSPTIGGSASNLYTQQNQAAGIVSASTQESEDSSRLETQLSSRDSYHSEEGPADKAQPLIVLLTFSQKPALHLNWQVLKYDNIRFTYIRSSYNIRIRS